MKQVRLNSAIRVDLGSFDFTGSDCLMIQTPSILASMKLTSLMG